MPLRVRAVDFGYDARLSHSRMVDIRPGLFVDTCTVVPEFHGIGNDARVRNARIVEEPDARIFGCEEKVVRITVHGREHQALALGGVEREGRAGTGVHGVEAAALNVIFRGDYVFEFDRRPGPGSDIVVIVVAGREAEACEKQSRCECGGKVLFFHGSFVNLVDLVKKSVEP